MLQSLKNRRTCLLAQIQLDHQRLHQAPLMLHGSRRMVIRHLDGLRVQLTLCETILRGLQGG